MAERNEHKAEPAPAEETAGAGVPAPAPSAPLRGVRDMWQVPVLLLGVALVAMGLSRWMKAAPGPDFEAALASTQALIERHQYEAALAMLNQKIAPNMAGPELTDDIRVRYHLLAGDALYFLQREKALDLTANNAQILEQYTTARNKYEHELDGVRRANLADTLVSLGRYEEALAELRTIQEPATRRLMVLRRIIDTELNAERPRLKPDHLAELLAELRDHPGAAPGVRLWAVAQQARQMLIAERPDEALRLLLVEVQRLDNRLTPEAGPLFVLLGRAYVAIDRLDDANEQLRIAERLVPESDADAAELQLILARISQARERLDDARDRYLQVVSRFGSTPWALEAWVGLGEVEARFGRSDASREAYARAVDWLASGRRRGTVTVEQVEASIGQHQRERFQNNDLENALSYAELMAMLHPRGRVPADTLLRLAEGHHTLGMQRLAPAVTADGAVDLEAIDPAELRAVRAHFARAAEYFAAHATAAILTNAEASGQSLWNAADNYDKAGDAPRAIAAFQEFILNRPDDPKRLEAQYRLARVFQSSGEFKTAIALYETVIDVKPSSEEAYRSYVPLAQCYLLSSDDADWEKAESRLRAVLDGRIMQPSAPQFREALVEIGLMYRRIGRYREAIERLGEAIQRYPELGDDPSVLSHLADAHRLSAAQIAGQLLQSMPQNERSDLEHLAEERLTEGLRLYEQVRIILENRDPSRLTALDRTLLRNAMFYRGDCSYDLGMATRGEAARAQDYFEQAIRHYDSAAQRYADDPASLVAMIQIVNCYAALGKWREAETAHERARARLAQIPDSAWNRANTPLRREHWEQWLRSSLKLDELKQADASGSTSEGG